MFGGKFCSHCKTAYDSKITVNLPQVHKEDNKDTISKSLVTEVSLK